MAPCTCRAPTVIFIAQSVIGLRISEINFCVVVATLKEFLHLFLAGLTRVGAAADADDGFLALEGLQDFKRTFAVVNVSR